MNYDPFPYTTVPLLARRTLATRLLNTLARKNVSVVGRSLYGKSVMLSHLAAEAKRAATFTDVVLWDLRHFTPDEDSAFFRRFAEVLAEQLTAFGSEPKEFFANEQDRTAPSISEFLNWLDENKTSLLVVMDGLDGPLSSSGLSKNVWDNLCAWADRRSLRILAGSRRRLRELCLNPDSRTSDFFQRFDDPPTVLGAFDSADLGEFLQPLAALRPLEKGAEAEFLNQTGGVPILCAALARRLANGSTSISQMEVRAAAGDLLEQNSESIPAAWAAVNTDEQAAYAELAKDGGIRSGGGKLADELVRLGLAERSGATLRAGCELVNRFSEHQHADLRSVRSLFEQPDAYARNIAEVVHWRFKQLALANEDLRDFVRSAVENLSKPKLCLKDLRSITEHALHMVWKVEAPDGQIPKYQNPEREREYGPLPSDTSGLLRHLNWLTDPRNGVKPKRANRRIYCLANALRGNSDFGQHQGGIDVSSTFAATACLSAVELAAELVLAGLDTP